MSRAEEPTIPVRASVAFGWADATKRNTNGRRAIVSALLDDIEAHRPPPPMPDIPWRAGARVQQRGEDGQGVGRVWLCREQPGALVDLVTGADNTAGRLRYSDPDADGWRTLMLPGTAWRLVSSAVSL